MSKRVSNKSTARRRDGTMWSRGQRKISRYIEAITNEGGIQSTIEQKLPKGTRRR